jgi:hypothetical protein
MMIMIGMTIMMERMILMKKMILIKIVILVMIVIVKDNVRNDDDSDDNGLLGFKTTYGM